MPKQKKLKNREYLEAFFEHRNKSYGAYNLRKGYDAAVNRGLLIAIAIVLIPLGIYCYSLWYSSDEMVYSPYMGHVEMYNDLISPSEFQRINKLVKPRIVEENTSLETPDEKKPVEKKKGQVVPDSTITKSDTISNASSRNGLPGDSSQMGSTDIFYAVEVMPKFPGGMAALSRYISDNVRYPADALKRGISGTVKIYFYIRKDGFVDNVKVIKSVDPLLDAEAVRVIRLMPRWTPGYHHGRPVIVMFKIPIVFNAQPRN
jgi:periplasmic protein TonB